jgi:DNA-binding SARP family transcriptional activator
MSELRHTLNDAIGADPVQRTQDRYHLDPALIDVDLWTLLTAVDRAATAVEPAHHHTALRDVIRLYTGPVAESHTWLWLDTYRETVRRHVLDAYTALAEAEADPRAALIIVQDAIRIDPYNENLYQQAMHLHARLGSPDGIRRALRTITQRLSELDIPVSAATQHAASSLLERQAARERLRHPTT